jgi:hypothetical protein
VSGRHSLRRIRALPLAVRFALALAAGALALASVPWFLPLHADSRERVLIASCIAALALALRVGCARIDGALLRHAARHDPVRRRARHAARRP